MIAEYLKSTQPIYKVDNTCLTDCVTVHSLTQVLKIVHRELEKKQVLHIHIERNKMD